MWKIEALLSINGSDEILVNILHIRKLLLAGYREELALIGNFCAVKETGDVYYNQ